MKRLIYCDLDNTLMDSLRRSDDEIEVIKVAGLTELEYKHAGKVCLEVHRRFSYELVCEVMKQNNPDVPDDLYERLLPLITDRQYFFGDTLEFLGAFPREEIVVITDGDPTFQIPKLTSHGLEKRIGSLYCLSGVPKADFVRAEYADLVFFLDDAPRHVDAVKLWNPGVICIRVREVPYWETQKTCEFADAELPDLHSAMKFIKSIES